MEIEMSLFEICSLVLSGFTVLTLFFAVRQIKINRQQLYLATITKCIQDFRMMGNIDKDTLDEAVLWKYIDLVSEEMFYFEHDYIPTNVSIEWIDGMLDYLPVSDRHGMVLNSDHCIQLLYDKIDIFFIRFPKIRKSFQIEGTYNFPVIYSSSKDKIRDRIIERARLAKEILSNVKRGDYA